MSDLRRSLKEMNLIAVLIVVASFWVSSKLGSVYGWGYHAVALLVISLLACGFLRVFFRPLDLKKTELPSPENEDQRKIILELERSEREISRLQQHLKFDAFVLPVILVFPTFVCLIVLQNALYDAENRLWFVVGVGFSVAAFLVRGRIYDAVLGIRNTSEPDSGGNA